MTRSREDEDEIDPPKTGLFHALVAQRSLIVVVCLALSGAGALCVGLLPSGMYPELDFPRIVVIARAGDDPPQLMQASVVRPLEEGLASIPGIRRIRTRIIRGTAELALQFEDGTDMRQSMQLVG